MSIFPLFLSAAAASTDRFAPLSAAALFWRGSDSVDVPHPPREFCRRRAGCWLPASFFSAVVDMGEYDLEKSRKSVFNLWKLKNAR